MVKEVALVIGGTSGIGKEQVYRFAKYYFNYFIIIYSIEKMGERRL